MPDLQYYKDSFKNHVLTCELDTEKYKAFWLHKPDGGRCMSCRIIFTPEGIAIMGDITPTRRGTVSDTGYGVGWFTGELSGSYIAEKFLTKSFQPEKAAKEIRDDVAENDGLEDALDNDAKTELLRIAREIEFNGLSAGEAYRDIYDIRPSLCEDGFIGWGYNETELGWLCAIQQRFAELYWQGKEAKQ
jgi:hypothetical protein